MSNRASNEELHRALAGDEGIVPSSGFISSVMEAVRRDTAAPPPIPFPWKRALPGFVVGMAGAGVLVSMGGHSDATSVLRAASDAGVGWILAAALVSVLSVMLSLRFIGKRT